MAIDGKQLKQIRDALLDGYDETTLREMVLFEMNEDLDRIAGGKDLEERVLNLVKWAQKRDRLDKLVRAAHAGNPDNKQIKDLHDAWFGQQGISETSQGTPSGDRDDLGAKDDEQPGPTKKTLPLPGRGVDRWLATVGALIVVGLMVWYVAVNYGREPAAGPPTVVEVEPAATAAKTLEVRPSPSPVTGAGDASPGSQGAPVDVWVNPVDGAEYALVPGGAFVMGSDLTADGFAQGYAERELPQQVLALDDFWLMRTEVTNGQYARCEAEGPCTLPEKNDEWQLPGYANRPVTNVSWKQANDYAAWVGGRLPTEAEWEKACRGMEGGIYPWGDAMPSSQRLNYDVNVGTTVDVASYPPGQYGLYDMAGNVWEWTASQYAAYPYDPDDGREDPATDADYATRGGAFGGSPATVRCAFRNKEVLGEPDPFVGFRVASTRGGE